MMQILEETKLEGLEKARKLGPDGVLALLEAKGLVGRGGAEFLVARKWKTSRDTAADERFVICNADEGEPGTFKDKFILTHNAKTMVEGMLIAAYVLGAKRCFIYLRGEYAYMRAKLEKEIAEVIGQSGEKVSIEIVQGAGAYVCGEQTAIIQSIMGFRGNSMYRPPNPTIQGLWGKPTVINNVETLTCVPQALIFDSWDPKLRLFSLSGNIEHPGVYEFQLGVKMSTIIDVVRPKRKLKAMSFGCFGGIMPVNQEMEVKPEAICIQHCEHGAYSIILMDDTNNIVDISYSIAKFYTYESCGKCTPCREGTMRLLNLLKKVRSGKAVAKDLETMKELAQHIQDTSLCGLGQTAGNHVLTALRNFPQDFDVYMKKEKSQTAPVK